MSFVSSALSVSERVKSTTTSQYIWERLLSGRGSSQVDPMKIIKGGVRIDWLPFKGNFKGSSYHSLFPPPMRLFNAKVCEQFRNFITDTVVDWADAVVLAVWGRVWNLPSLVYATMNVS